MPIPRNDQYLRSGNLSQSHLKSIMDPYVFFRERDVKINVKRHFEIGSAVDYAIPYGLDALMEEVEILESIPTGKIHKLAEQLVQEDLEDTEENILYAREVCGYNGNLKDTTVLTHYYDKAQWYYNVLLECQNKILLTEEDLHIAIRIYQSLSTNKYTSRHVVPIENIVRLNHVHIYGSYKGVPIKGELDQIEVDMVNMTVRPIDFKTSQDSPRNFAQIVKKRRYDIQAATYVYLLQQLIEGNAVSDIPFDMSGFRMLPFRFVVETTNPERIGISPLTFDASPDMIYGGMYGVYPERRYLPTAPISSMKCFQTYTRLPGLDTYIEEYLFQMAQKPEDRVYNKQETEELMERGAITLNPW